MMARRKFSKEFKVAAIRRLQGGQTAGEVARALEVHPAEPLAVQWERDRTFALPDLGIFLATSSFASANEVNDVGQTVGSVLTQHGIVAAQWIIDPPGAPPSP